MACRTGFARGLLSSFVGAAVSFALGGQAALAAEVLASPSGTAAMFPPVEQPGASPAAAGTVVYVDPQTGAILREPAPGTLRLQVTPQEQNALSSSHQGLVQEPAAVPGGGIKLDLQGRFQSPMVVTIDANGVAQVRHLDELRSGGMN